MNRQVDLRSNAGMSLLSVVVATGVSGVLMMGVMDLIGYSMKFSKNVSDGVEFGNTATVAQMLLNSGNTCTTLWGGKTFNSDVNDKTGVPMTVSFPNGEMLIEEGLKKGGVKIQTARLFSKGGSTTTGTYSGVLKIVGQKAAGNFVGAQTLSREIPVQIQLKPNTGTPGYSNQIASCTLDPTRSLASAGGGTSSSTSEFFSGVATPSAALGGPFQYVSQTLTPPDGTKRAKLKYTIKDNEYVYEIDLTQQRLSGSLRVNGTGLTSCPGGHGNVPCSVTHSTEMGWNSQPFSEGFTAASGVHEIKPPTTSGTIPGIVSAGAWQLQPYHTTGWNADVMALPSNFSLASSYTSSSEGGLIRLYILGQPKVTVSGSTLTLYFPLAKGSAVTATAGGSYGSVAGTPYTATVEYIQ